MSKFSPLRPVFDIIAYFHSLPSLPGFDFFSKRREPKAAPPLVFVEIEANAASRNEGSTCKSSQSTLCARDVYHNPRLDPQNFLEGELSWNPATRLRQMLARPGIVVCRCQQWPRRDDANLCHRLHLVCAMVLVPVAHSKPDSIVCIKGR